VRHHHLLIALSTTIIACNPPLEGDVIAVGDSIFDYNVEDEASIPAVIGETLGLEVANAAIGGAQVMGGENPIPDQYESGDWDWAVMDGGGNDLNDRCGCGDCGDVMDSLLSEDGTSGSIVDLVQQARSDGARVAWVGYVDMPEDADFGFDRCGDELVEIRLRSAAMAEQDDGVIFVDASEAFGADELQYYDDDHVHPSIPGSRAIGELVAAAMQDAG
jgi:acyl-CoA thioesterase I